MCSLEIDHPYPPTKIMWSPSSINTPTEYLATTADYLRLWTVTDTAIEPKMTICDVWHSSRCGNARVACLVDVAPYN